ncbi:MAG: mannitol dehydrogenase family protein [Verrucomicrobiales bacterium]|nr:mannitol dehydrogenase family protein [Verrucomicrobiota bacterium JB025]
MKQSTALNQKNLPLLGEHTRVPSYDRSKVTAGIVHIGVGGFHRSHEAWYTNALMEQTGDLNWGICGVGLRESDHKMRDVLKAQDYLYNLIVKHPDGTVENHVIGSIVDFMLSVENPMAVIDRMAHEDTRIVSLTITEGGYNFHPVTGEFVFDNPDVKHDLANPDSPRLVFGFLTAALRKRRSAGLPPFTVQSCDNIQHNGDMTRDMLLAFAGRQDPELAAWIEQNVCFPNAMVDRITPVTTPKDIEFLRKEFRIRGAWPVTCEPFCQWVIEDRFSNGRPAWETVGAQFVPDVTPYEKMKIRLLNAGHSVLGLLGSIHGHQTIDGAVSDPLFAKYLRAFMDKEATPVLDEVEGIDLEAYKDSLIERFGNPNIKDNLARICLESSAKLPKFLISTIRENLATGGSIKFATLVIAAWCYYSDKGLSRHGVELDIVDEMKDELHLAAMGTEDDVLSFLRIEPIFGDLVENPRFTTLYAESVEALYRDPDIERLMQKTLGDKPPVHSTLS